MRSPHIPGVARAQTQIARRTRNLERRGIPGPGEGAIPWQPYRYAISDEGTENDLGPDGTGNFTIVQNEYAGWLISPVREGIEKYQQISGAYSVQVADETDLGDVTWLRLEPGSEAGTSPGTGPYWDVGGVYGHGFVGRPDPDNAGEFLVWYPVSLYAYSHYYMDMRLADGSRVSGTNPITLELGDRLGGFWQTFATAWD